MKKSFILIVMAVFGTTMLVAQDHPQKDNRLQPPPGVQQSFRNDHPEAQDVNWQRQHHQWHASQMDPRNKTHVDTYYDERGQRMDTHRQLDKRDVPREVDQNVRTRYHGNDNYNATRIERPNQSEIFQLSIRQGKRNKMVYMDNHGNEVKYYDHH